MGKGRGGMGTMRQTRTDIITAKRIYNFFNNGVERVSTCAKVFVYIYVLFVD